MNEPKTLFITGATGLVGSHAVEEALRRGFRVKALVRASSDTRWLDAWGVEKVPGDLEDAEALRRGVEGADWVFNCAAKVGDWGTLEEFRRLNVEALRLLLDAASDAKVERFVHVSSLGVYEGRDHFGTDETTPPAAEALDGYTRSKVEAEALALSYVKERGLPADGRPPRLHLRRARPDGPAQAGRRRSGPAGSPTSARASRPSTASTSRTWSQAIFLAAEVPGAVGEVFNVTDGARVSKKQFVGRVAELAGLKPPRRKIPLWLAWTLAILMERRAKRKGSTTPPLVNKARYKFLGLNLDYSIEKARRVLGYEPALHDRAGAGRLDGRVPEGSRSRRWKRSGLAMIGDRIWEIVRGGLRSSLPKVRIMNRRGARSGSSMVEEEALAADWSRLSPRGGRYWFLDRSPDGTESIGSLSIPRGDVCSGDSGPIAMARKIAFVIGLSALFVRDGQSSPGFFSELPRRLPDRSDDGPPGSRARSARGWRGFERPRGHSHHGTSRRRHVRAGWLKRKCPRSRSILALRQEVGRSLFFVPGEGLGSARSPRTASPARTVRGDQGPCDRRTTSSPRVARSTSPRRRRGVRALGDRRVRGDRPRPALRMVDGRGISSSGRCGSISRGLWMLCSTRSIAI